MAGKTLKYILTLALLFSFTTQAFAQQPDPTASKVSSDWLTGAGPKKHLATIIYAGLAGFILGLSTLPFYGRPQDKLHNVAFGAAFGVIAGTSYVIFQAASNPKDFYSEPPQTLYHQRPLGPTFKLAFSF